jgi:ribosomal protein S18 acetylase RimI-like enzyme
MDGVDVVSGPEGVRDVGAILGRAFAEDPLWAWVVRGADREQRLVAAFTAFTSIAARSPGTRLLVTTERTAAAVWRAPDQWKDRVRDSAHASLALGRAMRPGGTLRGMRLQSVVTRAHPREPHWYLEALGALPEARGGGGGARVVQPMLQRCDDEHVLAYLESSNPRNYSFYERHGFVREPELKMPRGCPAMIPMRREPR